MKMNSGKPFNRSTDSIGVVHIEYKRFSSWGSLIFLLPLAIFAPTPILGFLSTFAPQNSTWDLFILLSWLILGILLFRWCFRNIRYRTEILSISPDDSISFFGKKVKPEDMGKVFLTPSLNRRYWGVTVRSNGEDILVAGPVESEALAETICDEMLKAIKS